MKERPIIFTEKMVRAMLSGRKTQTRRYCNCICNRWHLNKRLGEWGLSGPPRRCVAEDLLEPGYSFWNWRGGRYPKIGEWFERYQSDVDDNATAPVTCRFGQPGERLWVRETFRYDEFGNVCYREPCIPSMRKLHTWRPSIHMPRRASRITLEIINIRVEQLQNITERDAEAEGCNLEWYRNRAGSGEIWPCPTCQGWQVHPALGSNLGVTEVDCADCDSAKKMFQHLWDSINAKKGNPWASNPFVWVVEFRVLDNSQPSRDGDDTCRHFDTIMDRKGDDVVNSFVVQRDENQIAKEVD